MTELQKIIERLQKANKLTSNCQNDLDSLLFQYKNLLWKLENNKLKKEDRMLIFSLLTILYDLNLYI
jgi:hypothetical protein